MSTDGSVRTSVGESELLSGAASVESAFVSALESRLSACVSASEVMSRTTSLSTGRSVDESAASAEASLNGLSLISGAVSGKTEQPLMAMATGMVSERSRIGGLCHG